MQEQNKVKEKWKKRYKGVASSFFLPILPPSYQVGKWVLSDGDRSEAVYERPTAVEVQRN